MWIGDWMAYDVWNIPGVKCATSPAALRRPKLPILYIQHVLLRLKFERGPGSGLELTFSTGLRTVPHQTY